jgi:hypothetical protein
MNLFIAVFIILSSMPEKRQSLPVLHLEAASGFKRCQKTKGCNAAPCVILRPWITL